MNNKTEDLIDDYVLIKVTKKDRSEFKRLDQFLTTKLSSLSRTFIKRLFKSQLITLNAQSANSATKIELKKMPPIGTILDIQIPPPLPADAIAENIPLDILFEDEHLIIINKPPGMVTHPAPGNYQGTLVNAILYHCGDLQGIGDQKRPGIVHRLDKGTSGVMVVAKNQICHEGLILLFSTHDIERKYEAILVGADIPLGGKLESTIGRHPKNRKKMAINVSNGKKAITHYRVLNTYKKLSHLEFKLETGRTHQIRVHCNSILHSPILMDSLYSNPQGHISTLGPKFSKILSDYQHPLLHAKILGFIHPVTKKKMHFEIDPPKIFQQILNIAKENS